MICNFYLSMAVHTVVLADLFQRYTNMLGSYETHEHEDGCKSRMLNRILVLEGESCIGKFADQCSEV